MRYRLPHGWLFIMGLALATVEASPDASWKTAQDLNGHPHQWLGVPGQKAAVLIFLQPDCPISNQYAPTLNRLVAEFSPRGISFYRVYPDRDLTKEDIEQHGRTFSYNCPAFIDPKHMLTLKAGATVTPEVAVYNAKGEQVYRGRIDDRYVAFGKKRPEPTREDLREVLQKIISGQVIKPSQSKAVGCYIDKDED